LVLGGGLSAVGGGVGSVWGGLGKKSVKRTKVHE